MSALFSKAKVTSFLDSPLLKKPSSYSSSPPPFGKAQAHTIALIYMDLYLKLLADERSSGGLERNSRKEIKRAALKETKDVVTSQISHSQDALRMTAWLDNCFLDQSLCTAKAITKHNNELKEKGQ